MLLDPQPFTGVCFRGVNLTVMTSVVEEAMKLQHDFPDIMAGLDAVRGNKQRWSQRCNC